MASFGSMKSLIEFELTDLSYYLDTIQQLIDAHLKEIRESLENRAEHLTEEQREEFWDFYGDDYWEPKDLLPAQLYSSFIVSWYSTVEKNLAALCRRLDLKVEVKFEDKERLGHGIERARNFLTKAKSYPVDNAHWVELKKIQEVRNRIAHGTTRLRSWNGEPDHCQTDWAKVPVGDEIFTIAIEKNFYDYLDKNRIVSIRAGFEIVPSYEFCKHLITFGDEMFSRMLNDLALT